MHIIFIRSTVQMCFTVWTSLSFLCALSQCNLSLIGIDIGIGIGIDTGD